MGEEGKQSCGLSGACSSARVRERASRTGKSARLNIPESTYTKLRASPHFSRTRGNRGRRNRNPRRPELRLGERYASLTLSLFVIQDCCTHSNVARTQSSPCRRSCTLRRIREAPPILPS